MLPKEVGEPVLEFAARVGRIGGLGDEGRKHGGHEPPTAADHPVADRVHALVNDMQPAAPHTLVDGVFAEAKHD